MALSSELHSSLNQVHAFESLRIAQANESISRERSAAEPLHENKVEGYSWLKKKAWRKKRNGHCNCESGNRAGAEGVRIADGCATGSEAPESGGYVFDLPQDAVCRARANDAESRDNPGKRKRALCPRDDHGNGQNASLRCGRGREVRLGLPLLCGKRGTVPGG